MVTFMMVHPPLTIPYVFKLKQNSGKAGFGFMYVVVQFYHSFKFYFLFFQTHYHTLPYPKTKENKI